MKLRFDRMYKAVEGDAPLKRLLLLFCFQGFLLEKHSFTHNMSPLSEERLDTQVMELLEEGDSFFNGVTNYCHYNIYISLKICIIKTFFFGSNKERRHWSNQEYQCSNSILYAIPFMYYLKEYFQPSKDEEVLSQLFKDALFVRSELKA